MVMALIVLLGFGVLFMFAFDEGAQGGDQSIESVIAHQGREIDGHQANILYGQQKLALAPARVSSAKELTRVKRENQTLRENLDELTKGIEAAKAELALKSRDFASYKDQYRGFVRGKAKGEALESLQTLAGVVYRNVSIREVTAIGIQIRHADGQKRIPFEELPEGMKDHFQFDPKQKDLALAEESATRDVHEAAVADASDLADEKMDREREKDAESAKEKIRRAIVVREGLVESINEEIKGLENDLDRAASAAAAARMAGRMHLNKSGSISSNIRSKQNRISVLQAEVAQMKARL